MSCWRANRFAIALFVLAGWSVGARAQTFPKDAQWSPLPCGASVMIDGYRDTQNAFNELDLVGDAARPAGFYHSDGQFLFLRMRLDADPAPAGVVRANGWGFEFDLDGNRATYELLISAAGVGAPPGAVVVYRNTKTTLPDDPRDPADLPPVATYPFASNGRTIQTTDAMPYGGNPDFFIDLAVPWSVLEPLGFYPRSTIAVWAGSSTAANLLDLDLACSDGAAGAPRLSGVGASPLVIDPNGAGPGSPDGGAGPGRRTLEGGPGCSIAPVDSSGGAPLWLLLALLGARSRLRTPARRS